MGMSVGSPWGRDGMKVGWRLYGDTGGVGMGMGVVWGRDECGVTAGLGTAGGRMGVGRGWVVMGFLWGWGSAWSRGVLYGVSLMG